MVEPLQVACSDADAWPEWSAPCVERVLPGLGSTWVHAYTFAEAARWQRLARAMGRGDKDQASESCLKVAQVVAVCRVGPGDPRPTFRVDSGGERQAYELLIGRLPGAWVEAVCHESDGLCLEGYVPPPSTGPAGSRAAAKQRLGEQLCDPVFWAALSVLCERLYGVSLDANDRPLGEVLTLLQHGAAEQHRLLEALGPLAALAAGR